RFLMFSDNRATWTSGEPLSPLRVANCPMISVLRAAAMAMVLPSHMATDGTCRGPRKRNPEAGCAGDGAIHVVATSVSASARAHTLDTDSRGSFRGSPG